MLTIIIKHHPDITRTISSILFTTPPDILEEIMIVGGSAVPPAQSIGGDNIYAAANAAASLTGGEYLVFIPDLTIFKDGWHEHIISELDQDDRAIVGTQTHPLDTNIMQLEPTTIGTSYFDWNLNLHPSHRPIIISDGPLAIKTARFMHLGGYDHELQSGHNLELCLKNWLCDGPTRTCPAIVGTVAQHLQIDDQSASRIANIWFDGALDRFGRTVDNRTVDAEVAQWDTQQTVKDQHQVRSIRWLIDQHVPALGRIYDHKSRYAGKTAAILCDGPSLDVLGRWDAYRYGFTIGLDYVPTVMPCDYVVSLYKDPVRTVLMTGKYQPSQFLLPEVLATSDGVGLLPTGDVLAGTIVFSVLNHSVTPSTLEPPFMYAGHSLLTAVHLAAFLGAVKIVLYGWDGKVVAGKSHTALIPHYNGGRYLPDNQPTKDMYAAVNYQLGTLARVLAGYGVSILKYSFV